MFFSLSHTFSFCFQCVRFFFFKSGATVYRSVIFRHVATYPARREMEFHTKYLSLHHACSTRTSVSNGMLDSIISDHYKKTPQLSYKSPVKKIVHDVLIGKALDYREIIEVWCTRHKIITHCLLEFLKCTELLSNEAHYAACFAIWIIFV